MSQVFRIFSLLSVFIIIGCTPQEPPKPIEMQKQRLEIVKGFDFSETCEFCQNRKKLIAGVEAFLEEDAYPKYAKSVESSLTLLEERHWHHPETGERMAHPHIEVLDLDEIRDMCNFCAEKREIEEWIDVEAAKPHLSALEGAEIQVEGWREILQLSHTPHPVTGEAIPTPPLDARDIMDGTLVDTVTCDSCEELHKAVNLLYYALPKYDNDYKMQQYLIRSCSESIEKWRHSHDGHIMVIDGEYVRPPNLIKFDKEQ